MLGRWREESGAIEAAGDWRLEDGARPRLRAQRGGEADMELGGSGEWEELIWDWRAARRGRLVERGLTRSEDGREARTKASEGTSGGERLYTSCEPLCGVVSYNAGG